MVCRPERKRLGGDSSTVTVTVLSIFQLKTVEMAVAGPNSLPRMCLSQMIKCGECSWVHRSWRCALKFGTADNPVIINWKFFLLWVSFLTKEWTFHYQNWMKYKFSGECTKRAFKWKNLHIIWNFSPLLAEYAILWYKLLLCILFWAFLFSWIQSLIPVNSLMSSVQRLFYLPGVLFPSRPFLKGNSSWSSFGLWGTIRLRKMFCYDYTRKYDWQKMALWECSDFCSSTWILWTATRFKNGEKYRIWMRFVY